MSNTRIDWPTSIVASVIATLAVAVLILLPSLFFISLIGVAAWWIWNQIERQHERRGRIRGHKWSARLDRRLYAR